MEDTKKKQSAELEATELELKQLELQIKRAQLAAVEADLADKELAKAERKFNAENMQQLRDEREVSKQTKAMRAISQGQSLRATTQGEEAHQNKCTHRKGGNGIQGFMQGKGQKDDHCFQKHMFANGDVWQRCLRCSKTWKPPVRLDFTAVDGTFNQAGYDLAKQVYNAALSLSTNSVMSAGTQWRFSDDGEHYRATTRSVNLR